MNAKKILLIKQYCTLAYNCVQKVCINEASMAEWWPEGARQALWWWTEKEQLCQELNESSVLWKPKDCRVNWTVLNGPQEMDTAQNIVSGPGQTQMWQVQHMHHTCLSQRVQCIPPTTT